MTSVAFIGLGRMGGHMCANVVAAGFQVAAYDVAADTIARAAQRGARPAESMADCLAGAEVLVTSLPGPPEVLDVLCGDGGAIASLPPGALVIDTSTSSLQVSRLAQEQARAAGVQLIDAPVAGQTIGAHAGTLAVYVGGEPAAFERALPILNAIGDPRRIRHVGPAGCGLAVKLLLNLLWFVQSVAVAEALTVGVRAGVALEDLHAALVDSPAGSVFLERDVVPLLTDGDYDEGFVMRLVTKDLGLAVDLARDVGVPVELSSLVEQIHRRARAAFGDGAGELSAMRLYEELAGLQLRFAPPDRPSADPPHRS